MKKARNPIRRDRLDTFLPTVDMAAANAMHDVLTEDWLLHMYGIQPQSGRNQ